MVAMTDTMEVDTRPVTRSRETRVNLEDSSDFFLGGGGVIAENADLSRVKKWSLLQSPFKTLESLVKPDKERGESDGLQQCYALHGPLELQGS